MSLHKIEWRAFLLLVVGITLGFLAGAGFEDRIERWLDPPPATDTDCWLGTFTEPPATDTGYLPEWDEGELVWSKVGDIPGRVIRTMLIDEVEGGIAERVSQLERDVERLRELTRTQSDLIVKLGLDLSRLRHLDLYTPDPIGVDD